MNEFINDQKLFALFVQTYPKHQDLFELWENAYFQGNKSEEAHLAEKLFFEMNYEKWPRVL